MLLPILAFDTSAAHCAAALLWQGGLILRDEPMQKGQAERLIPMLEEVLARLMALPAAPAGQGVP